MGMFGGMIAGALSGGAAAVNQMADAQLDLNNKQQMAKYQADIDTDKARAIANINEGVRQGGKLWDTTGAGGDAQLAFASKGATAANASRVDLETKLGPVQAANAGLARDAEGASDRGNAAAYAADPDARKGVKAKAQDSHVYTAGEAATAYELGQKKNIDVLLDQAARARTLGNEEEALQIEKQVSTLRGTTIKSYSDVVAGAKLLEAEADRLTDPMKQGGKSQKQIDDDAALAGQRRAQAADMVQGVAGNKGVHTSGGGGAPATGGPGPEAVAFLQKNPGTRAQFDARFGSGSADKVLSSAAQGALASAGAGNTSSPTPQEYGATKIGRLSYLEEKASKNTLRPEELTELKQLRDTKSKNSWWEGKAVSADL